MMLAWDSASKRGRILVVFRAPEFGQESKILHPWQVRKKPSTWRIIPLSKWLVTPIYKPFRPFGRGTTLLKGLTNHGY